MSAAPRNPHELIRRAVEMVEDVRDYEQGLCFFCQANEREGHTADCPWPEMVETAARSPAFQPGVAYMPVPRCDSCRWWQPFDADIQPTTIGRSAATSAKAIAGLELILPAIPDLGECRLFECRAMEQVHGTSKLIATRTGSGEATIITQADFGCVQWEAKDATPAR